MKIYIGYETKSLQVVALRLQALSACAGLVCEIGKTLPLERKGGFDAIYLLKSSPTVDVSVDASWSIIGNPLLIALHTAASGILLMHLNQITPMPSCDTNAQDGYSKTLDIEPSAGLLAQLPAHLL